MNILKNKVHQEMTSSAVSPDPCVAATIEEQDADFNQHRHLTTKQQIQMTRPTIHMGTSIVSILEANTKATSIRHQMALNILATSIHHQVAYSILATSIHSKVALHIQATNTNRNMASLANQ